MIQEGLIIDRILVRDIIGKLNRKPKSISFVYISISDWVKIRI